MEEQLRLHVGEKKKGGGGGGGEKGDSRETRKERWVGAVAIRKGLQEDRGSSNHRGAVSNAYQATVHFSWKVGCSGGTDGSLAYAQDLGKSILHMEVMYGIMSDEREWMTPTTWAVLPDLN